MPRIGRLLLSLIAFAFLAVTPARAQLTIEIVGGSGTAIPISVVPFESESSWPLGITGIVGADLTRSGLFRLVDDAGISPRPFRAEDVRSADFRARGADAVVVGLDAARCRTGVRTSASRLSTPCAAFSSPV